MTIKTIETLKQMVEQAEELTESARLMAERDSDYYHHHQYSAAEIETLNRRKQPIIVNNRIQRKIDAMIGIEQQGRTDPRAFPRNPQDADAADVATKALVYVDDIARFDFKRSSAFENLLVEGCGGVEVIVQQDRGMFEVEINRIRWEDVFYDPYSREKDFSDATYMGTRKWMSVDAALSIYANVYQGEMNIEELLSQGVSSGNSSTTYDDRPQNKSAYSWFDPKQKRIRIAQMYYKSGGIWYLSIFCGTGEIFNQVSPYLDENGYPTNPMVLMTCYIDRENNRYGVVRGMIGQQDEINKRHSKILHQLVSTQTLTVKGVVDSVAHMKRELAMPDGNVEINIEAFEDAARVGMKPFEIINSASEMSGQFALLAESKREIDMLGPNPSLVGQTGAGASGRAILAQQSAGMAELAPIYDSLNDWTLRVYRAVWSRIRQYWTEERWIRVTDSLGGTEFVGLNVPNNPYSQFQMQYDQNQFGVQNEVAKMDVDIIVDKSPDYVTLRHEQFDQLIKLSESGIPIPPEMIVKASSIQDKAEILKAINEQKEQAMIAQGQAMQAQQQINEGKQMLDRVSTEARAMRDAAAANKDQALSQKILAETQETQVDTAKTAVEAQRIAMGY
ncbi:MAG: hypothetical protein U5K75_12165 [Ahrensia sp.]|nr:hypothetical protein [Ahrensia sp.]